MKRKRHIGFRVTDEEMQVIQAMAHLEKLSLAALARRVVLFAAEEYTGNTTRDWTVQRITKFGGEEAHPETE